MYCYFRQMHQLPHGFSNCVPNVMPYVQKVALQAVATVWELRQSQLVCVTFVIFVNQKQFAQLCNSCAIS